MLVFVLFFQLIPRVSFFTKFAPLFFPHTMVDLSVPLALTRQSMYYSTIAFSTVVILLPLSVLSYLYFYSILIPLLVVRVPITFAPRVPFQDRRGMANIEPFGRIFEQTPLLSYLVSLNLDVICHSEENKITSVVHNVTLENYSARSTFVLNCEEDHIFYSNNWLVPYKLRHYVPPRLSDISKTVTIRSPYASLTGEEIDKMHSKLAAVNIRNDAEVDDNHSFLAFHVQWDGIRYYMVTYYKSSLVVGTILFWASSSFVCLVTALITWSKYNEESASPTKRVKVKTEKTG